MRQPARALTVEALNPTSQRLYLASIPLQAAAGPGLGNRIYFPHLPQIEAGQLVGLIALSAFSGPAGNPGNISQGAIVPINAANLSVFNYLTSLLVTLVNKRGEVLFDRIPYATLFPINGKVKRYNAVNIDSRNSFFTFPAGTIISGNINANLGFYMNYQNY